MERPPARRARSQGRMNVSEVAKAPRHSGLFQNAFLRRFLPRLSLSLSLVRSLCLPFLFGRRRRRLARAGSQISQFASRRTRHRSFARSAGRAGERARELDWQRRRRKFGNGPTPPPTENAAATCVVFARVVFCEGSGSDGEGGGGGGAPMNFCLC